MASPYLRGGIPVHVNYLTAVATVEKWEWQEGISNFVWFKNTGTGPIVLSFTEADATAGRGITIASGASWEGPAELARIFTKSAAAESFEAVAFVRRG